MVGYRTFRVALMLALFCCLTPAFGFKYQRSRWELEDLPIPCYLNTASVPEDLAVVDVEQAVIRSMDAWNTAAGLRIFSYAGRVELEAALADDGWNAISFVSTDWLVLTAGLPANRSTIGTTCTWGTKDPIGGPPRHGFTKQDFLRAFDIALNAETYRWIVGAKPNQFDIQSAITHELGHVLSLGHPDDDPRQADAPTMVERMFPNNTKLRTLEADDIAGVQSIYHVVSGVLRENSHWQNMIFINGDFVVPHGVSLRVSHATPQTIVHFSPGAKLIVEGGLTIDSPSFNRVRFTGSVEIRTNELACQISDCTFEGFQVALTLTDATDVSVTNCQFLENPIGIEVNQGQQISVTDCMFNQSGTGISLTDATDVSVENCEFVQNQIAVRAVNGARVEIGGRFHKNNVGMVFRKSREVQIAESILEQNDVGIRLMDTDAQMRSSEFTKNGIGVEIHGNQPIRIRESSIIENQIGIRVVSGTVDLGQWPDHPGGNNLFDNTAWNIKLENPLPAPIFAQGNYWGDLELAEIDRTIRDDDEDANLPTVQFEPTLNELQLVQAGWRVEFVGIQDFRYSYPEGDRRKDSFSACRYLRYDASFRVIQLDSRTPGFTVQPLLSPDATHNINTAFQLGGPPANYRTIDVQKTKAFQRTFLFPHPEELNIEDSSRAFYFWARLHFDDGKAPLTIPGKWLTITEELPDLSGRIDENPSSARPGEQITIRYSTKNTGRPSEAKQTVQFYLSKWDERFYGIESDYWLVPKIQLPALEGEWASQLTVPPNVPPGVYLLWIWVDRDNTVTECSGRNNRLPSVNLIEIGAADVKDPQSVQLRSKRPVVLGKLKTELFQNYPNPFNPETWIPYQLAHQTPVQIVIYDVEGRLVRRLNLGAQFAGRYFNKQRAAHWDGRNENGELVSSGICWYQLQTKYGHLTKRMVVQK